MLDDFFADESFRAAFATHLGFRAVHCGAAGWAFERRRLGLRRVEMAPLGLYTCLGQGAERTESLKALMAAEARAPLSRACFNLNPLDEQAEVLSGHALARGYQAIDHQTHLLSLASSMDETRRRYHATKRAQATRPAPAGSVILQAQTSAHMDDYQAVYQASLQRWGREEPLYTRPFLDDLLASPPTRLWMHYVAGRLACAMVVLYSRHYALYWQGVSQIDSDQKAAFPMVRLMDAVLTDLTACGIPCLNLGASEGLPNVRRFKAEFGAQEVTYRSLVHEAPAWRALAHVQARLRALRRGRSR